MDFQKMWFLLKEKLGEKNSWGKNELKTLMEDIEIKENKSSKFLFKEEALLSIPCDMNVDEVVKEISDRIEKSGKLKGEF